MVSVQDLMEKDYYLSKKIASFLSLDGFMRKFFQVITLTGTAPTWLIAMLIAFFTLPYFRAEAYTMFMVNFIMMIVVFVIKLIIRRPRPEFKDDRYLSVSFDVFSFPSGHATRSAYIAVLMPMYAPELAFLWYIWAVVMIISRLVLGVHYVSDIIAGVLLGFFAVLVFLYLGWLPYFPFTELVI